ncbi:MAG: MoxR family ATPase [Gammaproteobacteria bacterium]|nr:MoxR family ATPase [Gammaproteobacteria bacterium]
MSLARFTELQQHIATQLVGQTELVRSMLVCLLCDGHLLIEGMPGLAKTTAVKALSAGIEGDYHRVQFTPDLLPSDLVGSDIISPGGGFEFRAGPIFQNLLLADEINRAPAKVQSALLEAMGERQVTVGAKTYGLPELFLVMATQNPVEQEGTYNLPEAQLDRFLIYCHVDYPKRDEELEILRLDQSRFRAERPTVPTELTQEELFRARREVAAIYLDATLEEYIVDLVLASRQPAALDPELASWIRFGASPRASQALARCARALAWLEGDDFVTPFHVQTMAPFVLTHRILLSFEAEAEGIPAAAVVERLLSVVALP